MGVNFSVSGTVGATTLSAAQLATHDHYLVYSKDWGATGNWGKGLYVGTYNNDAIVIGNDKVADSVLSSKQRVSGSTSLTHTHSLTAKSGNASSLPPYYALAYIMRIA